MFPWLALAFAAAPLPASAAGEGCLVDGRWTAWAPGFEVGRFPLDEPAPAGDGRVVLARIDPASWRTRLVPLERPQTARAYAAAHPEVVAVTNAGMFAADGRTHVGSMVVDGRERGRPAASYLSVAEWEPEGAGPPFRIRDLDAPDPGGGPYRQRVQNLRLVRHPGENRWHRRDRRWSEAALGEDGEGRMLLVFARSPYTMRDLDEGLLALPVGLRAAQHLEGGPEAQLLLRAGGCAFEGFGSWETGFHENDDVDRPWPVPNLLVVTPRGG